MSKKDELLEIAKQLPKEPGIYRYFDSEDIIIYVGKAKDLRKRVTSYFLASTNHNNKTKRLVTQIQRIEYTVVQTEYDALLLENNFIKKHKPKYNILLKDDKTYPYIIITKERFPKIAISRKVDKESAYYFGPYSNGIARKNLLDILEKTFHFRNCSLNLSQANIDLGKYKVCMEYHIGNCKAPCVNYQTETDYNKEVQNAKNILKGNFYQTKQELKSEMLNYAKNLAYEKAELTKNKLISLENFESKSIVVNPNIGSLDIYTFERNENQAFINYMHCTNGIITASSNHHIKNVEFEEDADVLGFFIFDHRQELNTKNSIIITNIDCFLPESGLEIQIPKIGDKKKLIDLSLKNVSQFQIELINQSSDKESGQRVLETLMKDLRMTELPKHIECFDNSNIQGTNPVASMVCFKMGKPSKKDYRHYKIKTVEGPNDFESMREIVTRRYKRLVEENAELPQLVIIDGGKGQLGIAIEALKAVGVYQKLTVVGIAKRLEEIYFPEDKDPLLINKKSESLKLIQKLRNEAHRFAITFHRDLRSKNFIQSELSSIEGIGSKTEELLLKKYKSIDKIKKASLEELSSLIGSQKAEIIKKGLN
jgi:excinuclease ABC subunit C